MVQQQRQPTPQASTVASCSATDCQHNDDRNCTAGEIQVEIRQNRAVCATYSPQKPKPRP